MGWSKIAAATEVTNIRSGEAFSLAGSCRTPDQLRDFVKRYAVSSYDAIRPERRVSVDLALDEVLAIGDMAIANEIASELLSANHLEIEPEDGQYIKFFVYLSEFLQDRKSK